MPPVLLTRDPAVIKSVLLATGDKPGQLDRDTSPMTGIARATGVNSLLVCQWKSMAKTKANVSTAFWARYFVSTRGVLRV